MPSDYKDQEPPADVADVGAPQEDTSTLSDAGRSSMQGALEQARAEQAELDQEGQVDAEALDSKFGPKPYVDAPAEQPHATANDELGREIQSDAEALDSNPDIEPNVETPLEHQPAAADNELNQEVEPDAEAADDNVDPEPKVEAPPEHQPAAAYGELGAARRVETGPEKPEVKNHHPTEEDIEGSINPPKEWRPGGIEGR